MSYQPELDKIYWEEKISFDKSNIILKIASYAGGSKKIQVSRELRLSNGETKMTKLGRMNRKELEALLPLLRKASKMMDQVGSTNNILRKIIGLEEAD